MAEYAPGKYSHRELEALWVAAGGNPNSKNIMAAIAEAESGGKSWEVNSIGATGLWQIHPGGTKFLDPLENAKEAVRKFNTQGISGAWVTYNEGTYQKFLVGNENISTSPSSSESHTPKIPPTGLEDPLGEVGRVAGEIKGLTGVAPKVGGGLGIIGKGISWLDKKENWIRIFEVIGGGVLLAIAVKELFHIEPPTPVPVPIP